MKKPKRPANWKMPAPGELDLSDPAFRWRLILGSRSEEVSPAFRGKGKGGKAGGKDEDRYTYADAIDSIFDFEAKGGSGRGGQAGQGADLSPSSPYLPQILDDIRRFFPREVVTVIQKDLIERKGLKQLLFEPETLETLHPNVGLVSTLLSMKELMPDSVKDSARRVVRAVVEEIERRLRLHLEKLCSGKASRSGHRLIGDPRNLDWRRTIRGNLRNYDPAHDVIVPERLYYWETQREIFKQWRLILAVDQSGSMADSVVYSSVLAAVFASLKSIKTHVLLFDTEVVDMSEHLSDPVDLLFGAQLGGGTDIARAVGHATTLMTSPERTIFVLITDLYEGGDGEKLLSELEWMVDSRAKVMTVLALTDTELKPDYDHEMARRVRALGVPVFACTPERLADLVVDTVMGRSPTVTEGL
jgi:Mg-chelatase subunit ChlD